jgi:membrane fusion protein (multidrug efflux system)
MVIMLAAVAAFISAIGFVKYRQIQTAIAQASSYQPPPEAVTTTVARAEEWAQNLSTIGSAVAVQGVTVSADLPGIVERISFDSGNSVQAGDVMVVLDTRQEQAQLAAAEARRELARLSLDRIHGLRAKGVTSQAEHDAAVANHDQEEASVREIRAAIDRKTIRAPFAGILGIRLVNLGQYLQSGEPVASLQSFDPIHVNFGVPQQDLGRLKVGGAILVSLEGTGEEALSGTITAVDSIVDEATRNVQIQATLRNRERRLRPGMFVEVEVVLDSADSVVTLPASAIRYAPYGESIFIVEDVEAPNGGVYRGVRQEFVKLGGSRGDQVAVLSGIEPGEEVVTSGVFKLRNGAAVLVTNEILPGNDPAPQPEES